MGLENFKRGESQEFYDKLPAKEKQEIENFVKYVSISSKSSKRLNNNRVSLITFRKATNKELSKTTLQDLRHFLAELNNSERTQSSRNDIKHTVKRFLKWKFKDWSERFNDLSDIKLVMKMNEEKINSDSLLKREDINKIMNEEKSVFWKAFFITLYESGLRPIELRTLTWDRIKFNVEEDLSEINIYATKTSKARSVYVQEGTYWLKGLKEESESPLVFPAVRDKTKAMGKELPAIWLKRISQKVLGREVYPYILRHSRATELYTNADIPDKTVQKFLGHSKSMGDVYTHLSNKDVKEAMSKTIYKKKEILSKEEKNDLQKLREENKSILERLEKLEQAKAQKKKFILDELKKSVQEIEKDTNKKYKTK
jgi:integrase